VVAFVDFQWNMNVDFPGLYVKDSYTNFVCPCLRRSVVLAFAFVIIGNDPVCMDLL
jgi:hypothetical protein